MKTINLHQVDAFTDQLFGGNPAGVVTNADDLTDHEMTNIAREMNLSETAFVLKPSTDEADVKLRFFTPGAAEIKFCGHATVGALFQLARQHSYGLGDEGRNVVRVETNAGVLDMSVANKDTSPSVTFAAPSVAMEVYRLQSKAFADEFGIPATTIDPNGTILVDRTLNYVYIPIVSLEDLAGLTFDFTRVRERFGDEGVVIFCLFTNETKSATAHLHARGLAPNVGVDEDPFTGSMQSGLIHAAKQNDYIDSDQKDITTEQGYFIDRPGFAQITHDSETDEVCVTARAAHVFSTMMEL